MELRVLCWPGRVRCAAPASRPGCICVRPAHPPHLRAPPRRWALLRPLLRLPRPAPLPPTRPPARLRLPARHPAPQYDARYAGSMHGRHNMDLEDHRLESVPEETPRGAAGQ